MVMLEGAVLGNSYIITIRCYDEAGTNVIPTTSTWSLRNRGGAVINSRLNVALTPALQMTVVLNQADLAIGSDPWRVFEVKSIYDSSYGTGLEMYKECTFKVREDS